MSTLHRSLGMIALAIYLILVGLIAFVPALSPLAVAANILAIVAGILILLGK